MASRNADDLYLLSAGSIENPPATLRDTLKRIGPGLVTASAVVGTGELIATPVLGAENGYSLLWLVVLSCAIKIVVQNELGRYAIGTGETALEAFNRVPGPRLRVSWVVWLWFLMHTTTLMTQSGMLAGIAEVLNRAMPSVPILVWVWAVTIGTIGLLVVGRYGLIEKVSVSLVVCFTLVTVGAAHVLLLSPGFRWGSVVDGLSFHLPEGGLITAVAVFGITGVGSADLTIYPYWCIEKGYARYAGPLASATRAPSTHSPSIARCRPRPSAMLRPRKAKYSREVPTMGCPCASNRVCMGMASARPLVSTRATSSYGTGSGTPEPKYSVLRTSSSGLPREPMMSGVAEARNVSCRALCSTSTRNPTGK